MRNASVYASPSDMMNYIQPVSWILGSMAGQDDPSESFTDLDMMRKSVASIRISTKSPIRRCSMNSFQARNQQPIIDERIRNTKKLAR